MNRPNGRLAIVVAAVSVLAVAAGGAVAYQQGPQLLGAGAAPLAAQQKPSTPTPKPSVILTAPAPTVPTGPVKVTVDLAKLRRGKAPQTPYLVGRQFLSGTGWIRTIPEGGNKINQVLRAGDNLLADVSDSTGGQLLKIGPAGILEMTSGVSSLVGGKDGSAASVIYRPDARGTIRYEKGKAVQVLVLPPGPIEVKVLAVANGKVYYHWQDGFGQPWKLFEWTPGAKAPRQLTTVPSAAVVSSDGAVAGSSFEEGPRACTTLTLVADGTRLWRSCGTVIKAFTPSHAVTIGTGGYGESGAFTKVVAHDTATGKVIREFTGTFEQVVPEDDEHVLLVARTNSYGGGYSIVRCAIRTGNCEAAVGQSSYEMGLNGFAP